MEVEGKGKGLEAALIRVYHLIQNSTEATKWSFKELFGSHNDFGTDKIPKRSGDVAVVTGGARGIGAEVVKKLLQADMQVFIGCRNVDAGNAMIKNLRDIGITNGLAECISLDLTSLASVRTFAKSILDVKLSIHILINNAGIMWVPFEVTPDGFESQFQVNYLSHFLLTNLLLPQMMKSVQKDKTCRIVNVSSIAQYGGDIQLDNLQLKKNYSSARAYQNSKLMQVLSSNYLDTKFKNNNIKIAAFSVHPGVIVTDLYNTVFGFSLFRGIFQKLWKSPEQGADGIVFAALSPELEGKGGLLLGNSQELSQTEDALNGTLQQKLWDHSCELVGLDKNYLNSTLKPESLNPTPVAV